MTKVRLYRDEAGYPRAEAPAPCEALGWMLEQDVQGDLDWCRELLEIIGRVRGGALPEWSGTGNAHALDLAPGQARIETLWAEPPAVCELTLDDLEQAVRDWLAFLQAQGRGE